MTGVVTRVTGPSIPGLDVPMIERDDGDGRMSIDQPCLRGIRLSLDADRPCCSANHSASALVRANGAVNTRIQSWRSAPVGTPSVSNFELGEQGRPR